MVGDGVNDVMALKQAQLAISMNQGSQITKDIADMVLLNNSLTTLVKAFDAGAEIKQKILVSTKLFLTKNLIVIVAILLVGFVQLPFPIQPRQLSVLTFPAVTAPTILIALGLFRPRKIHSFNRNVLGSSLLTGVLGGIAITIGFIFNYSVNVGLKTMLASTGFDYWEVGRPQAQGIAVIVGLIFTLFVFWDSCHISIWRPWTFKRSLSATFVGLGSTLGAIALLLSLPTLFEIERPDGLSWLFAIALPFLTHYLLRVMQCHRYFRGLLKLFDK
jgi:cation-transporting ATPase E